MLQRLHVDTWLRAFIKSKVIAPPVIWYTWLRFVTANYDALGIAGAKMIVKELLLVSRLLAKATSFAHHAEASLCLVLLFEKRLFVLTAEESVCSLRKLIFCGHV